MIGYRALRMIGRPETLAHEYAGLVLATVLALCLTHSVAGDDADLRCEFTEFGLLATAVLVRADPRSAAFLAAFGAGSWLVVGTTF